MGDLHSISKLLYGAGSCFNKEVKSFFLWIHMGVLLDDAVVDLLAKGMF